MANSVNNFFKKFLLDPVAGSNLKVMLLSDSHTQDPDTQEFIDDVSTNEISGSGYSAGGATVSSPVSQVDHSNDIGKLDANDVTWSGLTADFRYAAVYIDSGDDTTSRIIAIYDLGAQSVSGANYTIQWGSNGLLTI